MMQPMEVRESAVVETITLNGGREGSTWVPRLRLR